MAVVILLIVTILISLLAITLSFLSMASYETRKRWFERLGIWDWWVGR